jgi:hypothetical protein
MMRGRLQLSKMTVDYIIQQEVGVPGQLEKYLRWSTNYLIDRLKQRLASVTDSFDNRYYYSKALGYLSAGACDPVPLFTVYMSDLNPELIDELKQLDQSTCRFVLKQVVGRIIEDVDFRLYHNSISKVLEVTLK